MSKALEMMTAAMSQAKHELACTANTNDQLRRNIATLKADLEIMSGENDRIRDKMTVAVIAASKYKQRAELAERDLDTLRSQVAALLPKPQRSLGSVYSSNVYGSGAGDLDMSRDNGMVQHGELAE